MGVSSIRFNEKDEQVLSALTKELNLNRSEVIKKALYEFFEDLVDRKYINIYEEKEKKNKLKFHTADEILKAYDKKELG